MGEQPMSDLKQLMKLIAIPEELKNYNQWVNWRYETRNEKVTKPPIDPKAENWPNHEPVHARSDNQSTWDSHSKAILTYSLGGGSGNRFCFHIGRSVLRSRS